MTNETGSDADGAARRVSVDIDETLCVGSGLCAGLDPDHFRLGPDDVAEPVDAGDAAPEHLREVAACCPSGAIRVLPVSR